MFAIVVSPIVPCAAATYHPAPCAPTPVLDQPAALCRQFRPDRSSPEPHTPYAAGDAAMLDHSFQQAYANYYAIQFCPKTAGHAYLPLNPILDDSPASCELQIALADAASGDLTSAVRELYLMKDEAQAAGEGYFFLGNVQWGLGEEADAVESWRKSAVNYGEVVPPDTTLVTPDFSASSQYLLRHLAHVAAPKWPYASGR